MHTCIYVHTPACTPASMSTHLHAHLHPCPHTCMYVHTLACTPTSMSTHLHAHLANYQIGASLIVTDSTHIDGDLFEFPEVISHLSADTAAVRQTNVEQILCTLDAAELKQRQHVAVHLIARLILYHIQHTPSTSNNTTATTTTTQLCVSTDTLHRMSVEVMSY